MRSMLALRPTASPTSQERSTSLAVPISAATAFLVIPGATGWTQPSASVAETSPVPHFLRSGLRHIIECGLGIFPESAFILPVSRYKGDRGVTNLAGF
jgi:hypothetical protein